MFFPLAVSEIGQVIPFKKSVSFEKSSPINVVDITLPEGLAAGAYQFYAIAVDEDENLFDEKNWEDTAIQNWVYK